MLKSTYRSAAQTSASPALPAGWTEHKAPTGHTYYYNAETKQSTYTRPVDEPEELQIDYNATQPDPVIRASIDVLEEFRKNNQQHGQGHFTGGRSYQDRPPQRRNQGDRPKSKTPILNCEPWVLVKTKMQRRFVHNTETKQSLWKFPQDVMMAVIEMDRLEWEAKKKAENTSTETEVAGEPSQSEEQGRLQPEKAATSQRPQDYDSDSYEEVEVTDDEASDDDPSSKRPRLSPSKSDSPPPPGPVEFNEDDIAWQLAQMEAEEDNDDQQSYNSDLNDLEDEGLPITEEDNIAIFRSLLDDFSVNPYSTFDRALETPYLIDDHRYLTLSTTQRRREVFTEWSRDRIAEQQAMKSEAATTSKPLDPRVSYLRFLHDHATPKLYWPEFKRKYRKEPEMKDFGVTEKDREKIYREMVAKLKLGDGDRRKELVALLKGIDRMELGRGTKIEELPESVLKDVRFYVVTPAKKRDELLQGFLETLN